MSLEITIATPESLITPANHLAAYVGLDTRAADGTLADLNTFRSASWEKGADLYALVNTLVSGAPPEWSTFPGAWLEWIGALKSGAVSLDRPPHDTEEEIDLALVQEALGALVIYTGTETLDSETIFAVSVS